MGGVDNVPRGLIRMGQSFGLSTGTIIRAIILPGAAPAILSGFRVTASIAIVLLVAAEMIGAEPRHWRVRAVRRQSLRYGRADGGHRCACQCSVWSSPA